MPTAEHNRHATPETPRRHGDATSAPATHCTRTSRTLRPPALTLLELLVVIGILGVILAITIPSIRGAKSTADRAALAAHQQQVFRALHQYTADHRDDFPYWGVPGTHFAHLEHRGHTVTANHWEQFYFWGAYLEINGYNGRISAIAGAGIMRDDENVIYPTGVAEHNTHTFRSIHELTRTAHATPEFFTTGGAQNVAQHAGQRISVVAFPAHKGVLIQFVGALLPEHTDPRRWRPPITFADGHAETPRLGAMLPGANTPAGGFTPVHFTERGLLGRDTR